MNPTVSLGRIAGVKIGLNWSWAIVLALIVWSLDVAVFPDQNPGLAKGSYVAMAVAAALLFFVSLLLHELGHALQARREGVEIEGITLWLFGGVAQFKGEFPNAGAELRIAIAGPAVTAVIGTASVGAAALTGLPTEIDGVAAWLGYINLVLLAFNLVPALPLDGGRVLRALLWARSGDFAKATAAAAAVSRLFAFGLIGVGLLLFMVQGTFSGAWLAFIGWFLLQAGAAEARYPLVREALSGLTVRSLMEPRPVTAELRQTLEQFVAQVPGAAHYTAYPVLNLGEVVGLLPFARVLQTPRSEWEHRLVRDCMLPLDELQLLRPDESAIDALAELSGGDIHRGLVIEDGHLAGMVSITDISRILAAPHAPRRL